MKAHYVFFVIVFFALAITSIYSVVACELSPIFCIVMIYVIGVLGYVLEEEISDER